MQGIRSLIVAGGMLASAAPLAAAEPAPRTITDIDYAMYFNSDVRDAPGCAMSVSDGGIVVDPAVSNPAMTCPDMVSWKLLAEAIKAEFWKHWAADQQTWPAKPLVLCEPGVAGPDCCSPDSASNPGYDAEGNKAVSCPYFPGDHAADYGDTPPLRRAAPLSKAQRVHFGGHLGQITAQQIDALEPGREIRQSMAEIVFRNKPMFDYVFRNDLYNTDGVAKVFARNAANIPANAPYRAASEAGRLATIEFPVAAVMLKTNWIHKDRAEKIGLKEDPDAPFVKMQIESAVTDNNGTIFEPGEHWLVALHVSSKDIPNWLWATFEHVDNPGRCDFIGCNDSYGFASPDPVGPGAARNYTRPNTMSDDLPIAGVIFDPGKRYAGGSISPGLDAVLTALGIGTTPAAGGGPTAADAGWRSYRLKGAQNTFTTESGQPVVLGNSVTEGGFVASSSCMSCHARAAAKADGGLPALGVFLNDVDTIGYQKANLGLPSPDWFNVSNQPPALTGLQTDFVYGFFFANPLAK